MNYGATVPFPSFSKDKQVSKRHIQESLNKCTIAEEQHSGQLLSTDPFSVVRSEERRVG